MSASELVLLIATRSVGKLWELRPMLERHGLRAVDLAEAGVAAREEEDAIEEYESFEENAAAKAAYFHSLTGLATVADDSGLEVLALGGRPGVRSKRWAGRADLAGRALDAANNAKLLAELAAHDDRRARYVCAAAYVGADGMLVERGEVSGRILLEPRGTEGFGYDPLFEVSGLGRTFAELEREEKAGWSHRGRAFDELLAKLKAAS